MPKANIITKSNSTQAPEIAPPEGAAGCGWVVEVIMPEWALDRRFFAVGLENAADAEEAVLHYPGILRSDQRRATRRLSLTELSDLKVRIGGIRPCGWTMPESGST